MPASGSSSSSASARRAARRSSVAASRPSAVGPSRDSALRAAPAAIKSIASSIEISSGSTPSFLKRSSSTASSFSLGNISTRKSILDRAACQRPFKRDSDHLDPFAGGPSADEQDTRDGLVSVDLECALRHKRSNLLRRHGHRPVAELQERVRGERGQRRWRGGRDRVQERTASLLLADEPDEVGQCAGRAESPKFYRHKPRRELLQLGRLVDPRHVPHDPAQRPSHEPAGIHRDHRRSAAEAWHENRSLGGRTPELRVNAEGPSGDALTQRSTRACT